MRISPAVAVLVPGDIVKWMLTVLDIIQMVGSSAITGGHVSRRQE